MTDELVTTVPLQAVRRRRRELAAEMVRLEAAVGAPMAGRPAAWAGRLGEALGSLETVLSGHVAATERPGGLLATLRAEHPWLDPQIRRLEAEHRSLATQLAALQEVVRLAGDDQARLAEAAEAGARLVTGLGRHREHGADLLYQAYDVDLGGGE